MADNTMNLLQLSPRDRNIAILNRMRERENRYGLGHMAQIERIYRELTEIQYQDSELHQIDAMGSPFEEYLAEAINILDQIVNFDPTE
jgi:RNA polymerase-interacting CarD/CdnL/TRCF family regulator